LTVAKRLYLIARDFFCPNLAHRNSSPAQALLRRTFLSCCTCEKPAACSLSG
jgi:hypothetical protein